MEAARTIEPRLISDDYRKMQGQLHGDGHYGTASSHYAPLVTGVINQLNVQHVLDYGCGSQINLYRNIKPAHKITYQAYDPCVPEYADRPVPAEMVACIDVLEHIEPDYIDNVLDDLAALTQTVLFCSISMGPALKFLPDGRNAHLIQEPMSWWLPKIWSRFDIDAVKKQNDLHFYVIALAKPRILSADGVRLVSG